MAISHPAELLEVDRTRLRELFARLGETGVQAILDEFYRRMAGDLLIGFFFAGHDVPAVARRQREFLARAVGLASSYVGKPPATAHLALPPILSGHFDRRLEILRGLLTERGLAPAELDAWLGLENAFRAAIVRA